MAYSFDLCEFTLLFANCLRVEVKSERNYS